MMEDQHHIQEGFLTCAISVSIRIRYQIYGWKKMALK